VSDMKLIMENWRSFEKAAKNVQQTHVFLFENNEPVKTDFNVLLERCDNKQLTEDQLIKLFERSLEYESEQLLNEIEMLKKVGEFAGKVKEKVTDFFLMTAVRIRLLVDKGIEKVASGVSAAMKATSKFRRKHPVLFKVATIAFMAVLLYALSSILDPETAQAKIQAGDQVMSDHAANATRGAVKHFMNNMEVFKDMDHLSRKVLELQVDDILRLAQESPETIDLSQMHARLGPGLEKALNVANEFAEQIDKFWKEAEEMIKQAKELKAAGDPSWKEMAEEALERVEEIKKLKEMVAGSAETTVKQVHSYHGAKPTAAMFRDVVAPTTK